MDEKMIDRLIRQGENNKVEFKKIFYNLPDDDVEMVKDIVSLANSTILHEEDSFILVGYKECNFFSVDKKSYPDEAQIQQKDNSIVEPRIQFQVEVIPYKHGENNYDLLIIRIPPSNRKPHLIKNSVKTKKGGLYEGQCRIRIGSSSGIASRDEIAKMVHDADGSFDTVEKVIRYVVALQETGQPINIDEIVNLFNKDLIPSFHAPLVEDLDYIITNSAGLSVYRKQISDPEKHEQESLVVQAAKYADKNDFKLAKTIFEKVPHIEESYDACIVAANIYSRLNDRENYRERVFELIKRAIELDPNSTRTNGRVGDCLIQFGEIGEGVLCYAPPLTEP